MANGGHVFWDSTPAGLWPHRTWGPWKAEVHGERKNSSISIRAILMMIMTIKTSDKDKIKTVYLVLEGIFCWACKRKGEMEENLQHGHIWVWEVKMVFLAYIKISITVEYCDFVVVKHFANCLYFFRLWPGGVLLFIYQQYPMWRRMLPSDIILVTTWCGIALQGLLTP